MVRGIIKVEKGRKKVRSVKEVGRMEGRKEGRKRKQTDSPGKAFLRRWQVGTSRLKGSSGVKWWNAWSSIPG